MIYRVSGTYVDGLLSRGYDIGDAVKVMSYANASWCITRDDPHAASDMQEESIRLILRIGLRIKGMILSASDDVRPEHSVPELDEKTLGIRYFEELRRGIEDSGVEGPDDVLGRTLCFDASYVLMRSGCSDETMWRFHRQLRMAIDSLIEDGMQRQSS